MKYGTTPMKLIKHRVLIFHYFTSFTVFQTTCGAHLKSEFRLRNFGFHHTRKQSLYQSQWRCPAAVFVTYRVSAALYMLGWLLGLCRVGWVVMVFLTTWCLCILVLHLVVAAIITVYHCARDRACCRRNNEIQSRTNAPDGITQQAVVRADSRAVADVNTTTVINENGQLSAGTQAHLPQVEPVYVQQLPVCTSALLPGDSQSDVAAGDTPGSSRPTVEANIQVRSADMELNGADFSITPIPCYLKLSWLLFSTSNICVLVTVIYYGMMVRLYGLRVDTSDFHLHGLTSIVVLLEVMVNGMPVRLLHCIYPMLFGSGYVLFSLIFWGMDHRNVLYIGVLDWNVPARTVVVLCVVTLLVIPAIQIILMAVYKLKVYVYKRVYL